MRSDETDSRPTKRSKPEEEQKQSALPLQEQQLQQAEPQAHPDVEPDSGPSLQPEQPEGREPQQQPGKSTESDETEPLGTSKHEMKAMEFSTLTLEEFKAHPLTLRESKVWESNGGWTISGYEAGATADVTNVRLQCSAGHPKTLGAVWFLNQGAG